MKEGIVLNRKENYLIMFMEVITEFAVFFLFFL